MEIDMYFYYFLVLCAYIPGFIGLLKFKNYGKFPLILFCFMGMFIFHALGSILVFYKRYTTTGVQLFSHQFIIMLIAEVLIFYIITWPYLFLRKNVEYTINVKITDFLIIPPTLLLIGLILFIYRINVGTFLISDLLSGDFSMSSVGFYRAEKSFGSAYFGLYTLGFITFPALLASHTLLISLAKKRFNSFNMLIILLCFIPNILLGQKSGILWTATILFITYTIFLGVNNKPPIKAVTVKSMSFFLAAFIPTILSYILYFERWTGFRRLFKSLIYRIFCSYSETLAATVPMVEYYGLLNGDTLPILGPPGSFKGLDVRMHLFIYGIPGAAPVPAVGEGYVNFGWPGFICFTILFFIMLVIIQDLFRYLRGGLFSYAIMAWFSYLAIYTNFIGFFATFLSPLNYAAFLLLIFFWLIDHYFVKSHVLREII